MLTTVSFDRLVEQGLDAAGPSDTEKFFISMERVINERQVAFHKLLDTGRVAEMIIWPNLETFLARAGIIDKIKERALGIRLARAARGKVGGRQ